MKKSKRKRKRDARVQFLIRAHEARGPKDPAVTPAQWKDKAREFEDMWEAADEANDTDKAQDDIL